MRSLGLVVPLVLAFVACNTGDGGGTTGDVAGTSVTPPATSATGTTDPPGSPPGSPPASADAGADVSTPASCTCPAGQGCDPHGSCVACAKSCGAGTCVVGWEGGAHCKCPAGSYDSISGCAPATGTVCDGVTCSGHGTCAAGPPIFSATCECEGDYVSYGLACSRRDIIRCIDTDGSLKDKGAIRCNAANDAFEVCRDGNGDGNVEWVKSGTPSCPAGSTCSACLGAKCDSGDGSGGQPCPTGTICMASVHDTAVYQCVGACDCSTCGTCDPSQFTGYQRACGSTADAFGGATKACKSPCPHAGEGCLPYGQFAFCFPNEGCQSGAP
jgi:hypothetical protein